MSPESQQHRISAFFSKEYGRMVAFVRNLIDDAADRDGEDIVQDVMERVFSAADFTVPVENLGAYVYRALRNSVIDALRRRKGEISMDAPAGADGDITMMELLHDARYDTAREAEKADIRERLYGALNSLSPEGRAVILMTEFEGRSFREIAGELDVPVGTLLARKSRAMKTIRERLAGSILEQEVHDDN